LVFFCCKRNLQEPNAFGGVAPETSAVGAYDGMQAAAAAGRWAVNCLSSRLV